MFWIRAIQASIVSYYQESKILEGFIHKIHFFDNLHKVLMLPSYYL